MRTCTEHTGEGEGDLVYDWKGQGGHIAGNLLGAYMRVKEEDREAGLYEEGRGVGGCRNGERVCGRGKKQREQRRKREGEKDKNGENGKGRRKRWVLTLWKWSMAVLTQSKRVRPLAMRWFMDALVSTTKTISILAALSLAPRRNDGPCDTDAVTHTATAKWSVPCL